MPNGKPAGVQCVQLSADNRCLLFYDPRRPIVCAQFQASEENCGVSQAQALRRLTELEAASAPDIIEKTAFAAAGFVPAKQRIVEHNNETIVFNSACEVELG